MGQIKNIKLHIVTDIKEDNKMVLPTVDFSLLNSGNVESLKEISRCLVAALESHGFTYIIGHGISSELISNSFDVSKDFFESASDTHNMFRRGPGVLLGYVDGTNERFASNE